MTFTENVELSFCSRASPANAAISERSARAGATASISTMYLYGLSWT